MELCPEAAISLCTAAEVVMIRVNGCERGASAARRLHTVPCEHIPLLCPREV